MNISLICPYSPFLLSSSTFGLLFLFLRYSCLLWYIFFQYCICASQTSLFLCKTFLCHCWYEHLYQWVDGESTQRLVSMCPMNAPLSSLENSLPRTIKRQLSYNDETEERTSSRKVICLPSFPNEIRERTSSPKISQQLSILCKLEYRKLFLVLSYIGRLVFLVILQ